MNKIETYLFFDGNCAEAMRFYGRVLGGEPKLLPASEAPDGGQMFGAGNENKIMHARLDAAGGTFMASDWLAPMPYPGMNGFRVCVTVPTVGDAKRIFDQLADGGRVDMPFEKTFYSDGFGMVTDKFGTPWMVMAETSSGS